MSPTTPSSDCFLSVIAPLHDDADVVDAFIDEVLGVVAPAYENYELVLVDDGSTDGTFDRVVRRLERDRCIRLVRLSRRFGRDIAISAGLDTVIGDFVVVLLPETDPPELIPQIVDFFTQFDAKRATPDDIRWAARHNVNFIKADFLFGHDEDADLGSNAATFFGIPYSRDDAYELENDGNRTTIRPRLPRIPIRSPWRSVTASRNRQPASGRSRSATSIR